MLEVGAAIKNAQSSRVRGVGSRDGALKYHLGINTSASP